MGAEKPPQTVSRFDRFILDLTRGTPVTLDGSVANSARGPVKPSLDYCPVRGNHFSPDCRLNVGRQESI